MVEKAAEVRQINSYLPEEAGAYRYLSGLEYLEFMARFHTNDKAAAHKMVLEAAEISGLEKD